LRSPLLGQDDIDDDEYADQMPRSRKPRKEPGHDDSQHSGGRHHLHSPLLGRDDDFDEDEPPAPRDSRRVQKDTGGKPKLRSALLPGGDYDEDLDDDWDEDDEGNPDVLRSPLLAAKRKRPQRDAAQAPGPGQEITSQGPQPQAQPMHQQSQPAQAPQPAKAPQPAPAPPMQPPPAPPQQTGASSPFPGPKEPQTFHSPGSPPLPGWPQGQMQNPAQSPAPPAPPYPGEAQMPSGPPWQNRMSGGNLGQPAAHEVPPIIDDNEEFQLDLPPDRGTGVAEVKLDVTLKESIVAVDPSSRLYEPTPDKAPVPPAGAPSEAVSSISTQAESSSAPERRRRIDRRKGTDRRFSSLLDEKPAQSSSLDDDDFGYPSQSASRPSAGAGMAPVMIGVGALALGIKVWYFMTVAGQWDLAKMPDFILEQLFSGLACLGLIVFGLSCMKK
jgi:hypothetical protein